MNKRLRPLLVCSYAATYNKFQFLGTGILELKLKNMAKNKGIQLASNGDFNI